MPRFTITNIVTGLNVAEYEADAPRQTYEIEQGNAVRSGDQDVVRGFLIPEGEADKRVVAIEIAVNKEL